MDRPRIRTRHPGVYYREREDGSRQYVIWFEGSDGKGHFKNVPGNEGDAKRARAKVINDMAHGQKVAPSKKLFADFAHEWLEERANLSENTIASYRNSIDTHLIPRLGSRTKLSEVDVNRVARMIAGMQKDGLKAWTIRTTLTPLAGIMSTAARRGLAPANPVTQLERNERPKGDAAKMNILDSDEIVLLLQHAGDWAPVFSTLIFTGLRISELLSLRWEDIDWGQGILHVRKSKTKDGVREVMLMPSLQQTLAHRSFNAEGEFVFQTTRGTAGRALARTLKKAGITKKVRLHDLRHTHASILIHQGHPDSFIAEQMGHASAAFTRATYGHMFDGEKQREAARERMQEAFGQVMGKSSFET